MRRTECIDLEQAPTIPALFRRRVQLAPEAPAYHYYDHRHECWTSLNWRTMEGCVQRWQRALQQEDLQPGDRVAVMLGNSPHWVMFDQAALALGLVVVPLYISDHAENIAYILQHSGSKLLLLNGQEQWQRLQGMRPQLNGLLRVIGIKPWKDPRSRNLMHVEDWLNRGCGSLRVHKAAPDDLASIVYTSGTTGPPKGVMLSHRNMLYNAWAGLQHIRVYSDDLFLSFLPLSHTLERTIGYYLPMMAGAQVAYARSIPQLAEDMRTLRPSILVSVPRIFERVREKTLAALAGKPAWQQSMFAWAQRIGWRMFLHQQQQASWHPSLLLHPLLQRLAHRPLLRAMGGRMRFAISGGAALQMEVARFFLAAGLRLQQGYGLTEHAPVASVNPLRDNRPRSVGTPLHGVEARLAPGGELLLRSPCVMQGYWNNHEATQAAIDEDGWLHTGDLARIDEDGYLYITGRIKDILVLSNGEKICPLDLEAMLTLEPEIDQALVVGEGRPYLAALLVVNEQVLQSWCQTHGKEREAALRDTELQKSMLALAQQATREFPGYAKIRRVHLLDEPWSVEQGLLTATLKQRREAIMRHHADILEALYRPTRG